MCCLWTRFDPFMAARVALAVVVPAPGPNPGASRAPPE